jgi:phage tail sheath protein FI
MPVALTYPGVYIEEISGGVRTITGVATSLTAFVGRALRGPVDEPVSINSFADFERIFGGLWASSTLGYAVRDYYLNGGSQAIVVRLYRPDENNTKPASAVLDAKGLKLEAVTPGAWGNALRARVDGDIRDEVAASYGLAKTDLFNLTIRDMKTGAIEQLRNLSIADGPRKADRVLANESRLVRVQALPAAVPKAHGEPSASADIWQDDTSSTGVAAKDQASDGQALKLDDFAGTGKQDAKQGLYALDKADLFNLLCIPPYAQDSDIEPALIASAAKYCEARRALLIVDPPGGWSDKAKAKNGIGSVGTSSKNAALFFPRLRQPDPLLNNQTGTFAPCGAVAGVIARTDVARGVWKAPAGLDATLAGVPALSVPLTDLENGELNQLGVNCLRSMPPVGPVVWGARTLQGDDRLASEWKYIPVRRTALFIEESLYRGTQWVVFEPNDEPLWAQIRLNIGAFMQNLFRQGAFQGKTPREAYFVKCDRETTTQNDINLGIVNIVVGFAPLKPAEFVVIKLQQMAGQIAV